MSVELTPQNTLRSRNPATLEILGEVPVSSQEEILSRVASARSAAAAWRSLPLSARLAHIERFRVVLESRKDDVAKIVTSETGKPLIESYSGELFGPLETCRWLCRHVPRLLAPEKVRLNPLFFLGKRSYNVFEPLGVVAVISPWNYPFSIPVSTVLTALSAGNTVVLKPSPKTPLTAMKIAELFVEAGFPDGVVNVVIGDRVEARTLVLSDVDRVVFTGSVGGGRAIMSLAAHRLHPVTLELGGKHAAVVLADADVDKVAEAIVWSAFTNAGQACASIERLYVEQPVARRLTLKLAELTRALRLGDGMKPDTDVGPLIDGEQVVRVQGLVADAARKRGRIVAGGKARPDLGGHFFEPTLIVNVSDDMKVLTEEIFGPVLPVVVVKDAEEAILAVNNSRLGLGASIWTADVKRAEALARRIDAGMVWINDGIYSHSAPDSPWGGIKDSGFGRMHGAYAFHELVYVKHIGVDRQGRRDWHYPYGDDRLGLIRSSLSFLHGNGLGGRLRSACRLAAAWLRTRKS